MKRYFLPSSRALLIAVTALQVEIPVWASDLEDALMELSSRASHFPSLSFDYQHVYHGLDRAKKNPETTVTSVSFATDGKRFHFRNITNAVERKDEPRTGVLAFDGQKFQMLPWQPILMITEDFSRLPSFASGFLHQNPLYSAYTFFADEGVPPLPQRISSPDFWKCSAERVITTKKITVDDGEALYVSIQRGKTMSYEITLEKRYSYLPTYVRINGGHGTYHYVVEKVHTFNTKQGSIFLPVSIKVMSDSPDRLGNQEIVVDPSTIQHSKDFPLEQFVISPSQAVQFHELDLGVDVPIAP